jgi:hypothetical protein
MVCYLNQQPLSRWVADAQYAINEYEAELQQARLK